MTTTTTPRQILLVSLSRFLGGVPASSVISQNWAKHPQSQSTRFNTVGFDFDANDLPTTLKDLEAIIHGQEWDGIMIGWCLRGNQEGAAMFEQVVSVCIGAMRDCPQMKLMFCAGPDDVADSILRNFPAEGVLRC